jgi:hypothetical protein
MLIISSVALIVITLLIIVIIGIMARLAMAIVVITSLRMSRHAGLKIRKMAKSLLEKRLSAFRDMQSIVHEVLSKLAMKPERELARRHPPT